MFYAILAVGLAISWAQVGKRAQMTPDAQIRVMSIEDDCQPYRAPCAAYTDDFGLVLGPQGKSLRLQSLHLPEDSEFELRHFQDDAVEVEKPLMERISDDSWQVQPVVRSGRLRVSVLNADVQWVAEYPLQ